MRRTFQQRRCAPLFDVEEDRRRGNRNADPEIRAFIDQYTSLADIALREPRPSKLVEYYVELADIYLREKPRKIGN